MFENFPYTDFHELNLDWIIKKVKEYIEKTDALAVSFVELKDYVTNFIDNLDIQEEVNAKLDEMYDDGTLEVIIDNYIALRATHKYIFVGDSYMKNSATERAIMTYLPGYMGLTTDDYVDATKAGTGFARSGYEYLTALQAKASSVSNRAEITDIVVVGGWNDRTFTQGVVGAAMADFKTYCQATYPNATIKVAYVAWTNEDSVATRNEAINGILNYQQCGKYGMQFIGNSECINHNYTWFYTDGHHPSEDGAKNLAKYLASAIINGSADVLYLSTETVEVPSNDDNDLGVSAISNPEIQTVQHNNLTTVFVPGSFMRFVLASTITVNPGNHIVGRFPMRYLRPFLNSANTAVAVRINTEGSWQYINAYVCLRGLSSTGYVTIALMFDDTFTNVTAFQIDRMNLDLPAIQS